ncbi:MAG: NADH-quinone oxidoreductase subunit M [Actinomycetaceae bacterium]|nr:NADH-quinone oxidoreductase subunit M [Actinomycetaceae bacterium]
MYITILISLAVFAAVLLPLVKPLQSIAYLYGLAVSAIIFLIFVLMAFSWDMDSTAPYQFAETYSWIPQLGISYAVGLNGMSLVMVGLSTFLVPIVFLAARDELAEESTHRAAGYVAWVLFLEAIMIGIFAARDVFLFYVLFELMIIPVFFLIGRYGGENKRHASIKFLLYSLLGGLVMLVGVVAIFAYNGNGGDSPSYLIENLSVPGVIPGNAQMWMFITFFIAFAIKAPMFPVHTWLPDTTAQARPGTSTLLVGVLDKIGAYGMIAFCLPLFPDASRDARLVIMVLAVISIIWGGFMAIGSQNLMRLIAYTSVSHFGFMILGIFSGSETAMKGAILYMVAHGVATGALFLTVGFLGRRGGNYEISTYGGYKRVTPLIAGVFLVSGLATIAMPGLSGFVPEVMVLMGTFSVHHGLGIAAVFGMLLAALYLLWPYQKVFTGEKPEIEKPDMNTSERVVSAILIAAMLYLGFAPSGALSVIEPVAKQSAQYLVVDDSLNVEGSAK